MSESGRSTAAGSADRQVELLERLPATLREIVQPGAARPGAGHELICPRAALRDLCRWLVDDLCCFFATLVVEETPAPAWSLAYVFYQREPWQEIDIRLEQNIDERTVPTISDIAHAADWHEREAEDLFGLAFEGHPRLGEFILHEDWPEGTNPMRKAFDAQRRLEPRSDLLWEPPTVVEAPGAFGMPIGPVYSDFAESAHFLLETVGEDVITAIPRFFYKYRGVEKIAEGKTARDSLLLAERFSGTSAFAHGLAFCQSVEAIAGIAVPPRARTLRSLFAELERLRHHAATIKGICGSTALAVATSQAALIEEDLLRLTCTAVGHRYFFGALEPGGLTLDLTDEQCRTVADDAQGVLLRLAELERMLQYTSSFLDRLEEVGNITRQQAVDYGLVGPMARASGITWDLRKAVPYAAYDGLAFAVPSEDEGDGYARLRVLFREAEQAAGVISKAAANLPAGPVATLFTPRAGTALGATEAPVGATFHWVRLDEDGIVERYRLTSPSFINWHGFHLAAENFAFQDFPIILASLGLANAECDR